MVRAVLGTPAELERRAIPDDQALPVLKDCKDQPDPADQTVVQAIQVQRAKEATWERQAVPAQQAAQNLNKSAVLEKSVLQAHREPPG